jgi:hypothetical protein
MPAFWVDPELLTQSEAPRLDKWYKDLAVPPKGPLRAEAALVASGEVASKLPIVPGLSWYTSFSEPISVTTIQYKALHEPPLQDLAAAEDVTLDKWFVQLSVPTLPKPPNTPDYLEVDPDLLTQPEAARVDKWYRPLQEPIFVPKRLVGNWLEIDAQLLTQPETPKLDKWYSPLAAPLYKVARSSAAIVASGLTYPGEPIVPAEDVTVDKWFRPHAQPFFSTTTIGEFVDINVLFALPDVRFAPLSEPVRRVPRLREYPGVEPPLQDIVAAEVITPDKWYRDLAVPVRRRLVLTGNYLETDPNLLTQPEATRLDKWFNPLSVPVLPLSAFASLRGQVLDDVNIWPLPEVVTEVSKWHRSFAQPFFSETVIGGWVDVVITEQTEATSELPWFAALSLPAAMFESWKASAYGPASNKTPAPPVDTWYREFSIPVPPPPRLITAAHPYLFIDPAALTQLEATRLDKWFKQFEEPVWVVRRNPWLASGVTETVNILPAPAPLNDFSWLRPLALPLPSRRYLVSNQPFTTFSTTLKWSTEGPEVSPWTEEGAAPDGWTEETFAVDTWTEEDPKC